MAGRILIALIFASLIYQSCEHLLQEINAVAKKLTRRQTMVECIKVITDRYFSRAQNMEIIWKNSLDEVIEKLGNFKKIVRNFSEYGFLNYHAKYTKNAMIFLEGEDYEEDLKLLSSLSRFNVQGQFIINVWREFDNDEAKHYFDNIIKYLVGIERWNVVFLRNERENKHIRVSTYTIYCSENCGKCARLVDHGNCGDKPTSNELLRTYTNFNGCPINLATINLPPYTSFFSTSGETHVRGIEANIVNIIVKSLNATPNYLSEMNGTKIRESIKSRNADLGWGCVLQMPLTGITYSRSHLFVQSRIVIPQSSLVPLWKYLKLPFSGEVWMSLGTVLSFPVAVKLMIPGIRKQFPISYMLLGFFGIGPTKIPKKISGRLYFFFWLIFSYIVTQAYLACLAKFFTIVVQEKPIQTLDGLEDTEIVVGGSQPIREQFEETNPRIYRNWKVLSEMEYFANLDNLREGKTGIATYTTILNIKNITRGKETSFHVIPQYIGNYPISLLMPDSSPLLRACNRVIAAVVESGIIETWDNLYTREIIGDAVVSIPENGRRISLTHLKVIFFLLVFGYVLSGLVFILEIGIAHRETQRHRTVVPLLK